MKKTNYTIVCMRAIAIILVVLGHSIIIYDHSWGVYSSNNHSDLLVLLKSMINIIQMPLFFWISGYLYNNKKNLKEIFKSKSKRLLIPFIVFLLFWQIPIRYIAKYPFYDNKSIFTVILRGVLGIDCGHLWYLLSLFEMFLIFNIVLKIKNKYIRYILYLLIFILSYKNMMLSNILSLQNTFKYFIFFIFGYYFKNILSNKYDNGSLFMKCISIIIFIVLLSSYFILKTNIILKILDFIIPVSFILMLYLVVNNKNNKILNYISSNSFGIYLFHSPMLYVMYYYLPNINIILMVFINAIIMPILICFLLFIIRKTKLKFVIGE